MKKMIPFRSIFISSVFLLLGNVLWSQSLSDSLMKNNLSKEIAQMDSLLFDAFNKRDIEKIKILFSSDLEFYHDKDGLSDYKQTMESLKNLFDQKNDLNRILITGSLEVYPIKDYGAIETGLHKFCHTENGKPDCGTFKFIHVWKKTNNEWKLTRVISYDH